MSHKMKYLLAILLFASSVFGQSFGYGTIGVTGTMNGSNFMRSGYTGVFPFYSYGASVDSLRWYCNTITTTSDIIFGLYTDDGNDDPNIQICEQSGGEEILSTQDGEWIMTSNAFSAHTIPVGTKFHWVWLTDNGTSSNILMAYTEDADYITNSTSSYDENDYPIPGLPDEEAGNYGFNFNDTRRLSIEAYITVPITTRISAFGTGNLNDPNGRFTIGSFPASSKIATPFVATFNGTLTSISFGLGDSGIPDTAYAFIYSQSIGDPLTLLATSTDSMFVTGGAMKIYTAEITVDIVEGTTYWLGFGNGEGSDIEFAHIRAISVYSRSDIDLRPYDATWDTDGDANVNVELLAIAHYTLDDSIRHLYPIDDGDFDEWCGVGDCWPAIDDPARHDTTGTVNGTNGDDVQSYVLPDWADVGGDDGDTIDSVRIIGVVRRTNTNAGNQVIPFIYDGTDSIQGTVIVDGGFGSGTHFNDTVITDIFFNAPDGGAWTVTDIDNLQIGLDAENAFLGGNVCTQLNARVYYHVAVSEEVSARRRKMIIGEI